jgi:hypothetical protein
MIPFEIWVQHDNGNAPHLLSAEDAARLENNEWERRDSRSLCQFCHKVVVDHPPVIGALWLVRMCSGELVKF